MHLFLTLLASAGEKIAFDIPPTPVEPNVHVVPAKTTFSMTSPTINAFCKKIIGDAINEQKAAGLKKYFENF